ncbi:hypothetical protein OQA88_3220 [Cercophora sp. LCS_1]
MPALRAKSKPGRSGSVAKRGDSWILAWEAIDDGGLNIFSSRPGSHRIAKNEFPVITDGTAVPSDSAPSVPHMREFRVGYAGVADEEPGTRLPRYARAWSPVSCVNSCLTS